MGVGILLMLNLLKIDYKMKNFCHLEYEESGLSEKDVEKIINEKSFL